MRTRLSWLVIATTSTVVVSFVIPLCLLVGNLARERALSVTDQEARTTAIAIANAGGRFQRAAGQVAEIDATLAAPTTGVLRSDGRTLGDSVGMADDPEVAAAAGDVGSRQYVDDAGARVLVSFFVSDPEGNPQTVVVRSRVTNDDLHRGVYAAWAGIVALGAALLALALWLAAGLGRRISGPLLRVADAAHQLREGDLTARAPVQGTEETQELARALNGLADRTVELLANERTAVGDLSHRLRTPVTALRLDSEAVTDKELASRLQEHIAALQVTIDSIVAEARRPLRTDLAASCDASATVGRRVSFWRVLAEDQRRPLRVTLPRVPVPVALSEEDLADVVDVLIDNVFAHTPDGTAFEVSLTSVAGRAVLIVADRGPGLVGSAPGARRGSTGLGLDIVRRMATEAGGELHIGALGSESTGTRVELRLPVGEA